MTLTRRGRLVTAVFVLVGVVGVASAGGLLYLRSIGVGGTSSSGAPVEVTVPEGATAQEIGTILEDAGVIESAFAFRVAVFLGSGAEDIQAGRYELRRGLTATDALETLVDEGPVLEFVNVTFPEGSWLTDFARILDDETHISGDAFLELVTSGKVRSAYRPPTVATMEGLLFPSTYQVIEEDTARSIARRLAAQFEEEMSKLDLSGLQGRGISPYEAIIVASMVEAEARVPEDRGRIAAVIYNRLRQGIELGIDATVLYALGEHKQELTVSDLDVDSPYNTRKFHGLPPTPIGAPGAASLAAAMRPAEGDWLYFVVADCEGHHAFSTDYDSFLADKARYQALQC
ncbi:MAG: endolytic transglycosylase MltG [Actinomycetota bacterium]|nr:endolytic transglycosylase MltG [Actinomycetota bacterium]